MSSSPRQLALYRLKVPLREPYKLSFGPVLWFDTIIVEATDATGESGYGEATVLTGYTDETIEDAWSTAKAFAESVSGDRMRSALGALAVTHPFTATAFGTALDMLDRHPMLAVHRPIGVPILGLLHAREEPAMAREIDELLAQGYRTLKLKVGFELESDIVFVRTAQRLCRGRLKLRVDANQAYTAEEAQRFVTRVAPEHIELFEQPCPAGDWESHMVVAEVSQLPLMLDESIYGLPDIERAAGLRAAAYIKVKLMKLGSVDALAASISRIRELGMKPVLGNGVACDLGCWMEACVAARLIDNAGEMNGYLKACGSLLREPPPFRDGAIQLAPGYRPVLDPEAIDRYATDRWSGAVSHSRSTIAMKEPT
jgi:L-alanine-DL-glutamate epimerase-like enolase superfamily enzyme